MKFTTNKPLDFETMIAMFSRMPPSFVYIPLEFKLPTIIVAREASEVTVEYQYGTVMLEKWLDHDPVGIRITVNQ